MAGRRPSSRRRTTAEFARTDLKFHRTVAEASGNPFMASISALVELALTAVFTISSPVEDKALTEATVKAHGRIAEAILVQDADEARTAMKAVISEGFGRAASRLEADGAA